MFGRDRHILYHTRGDALWEYLRHRISVSITGRAIYNGFKWQMLRIAGDPYSALCASQFFSIA